MKSSKYIYLLILSIIIISCSSETSPTKDNLMSEYFPTTTGSWWKYENWRLDSTGTRDSLVSIDSIVIEGPATVGGREAFLYIDYDITTKLVQKNTSYVAIDGGKLSYFLNLDYGDHDTIPWVTYADLNANEWQMVFKDIIRDTMDYRSEYYYKMFGRKGVIQDFNFKNTTFKAQQIYVFSIMKSNYETQKDTVSSGTEDETLFLYGKGVGLVYMRFMMTKTSYPPLQGYETILLDYKIK